MASKASEIPVALDYRECKKKLHITSRRGEVMDVCSTFNEKYICCNVHVLKTVSNCPFDCSYCFLQNYLTNTAMQVIGDTKAIMQEVLERTQKEPGRLFRVGTWELGDSLALENMTKSASELIIAFAKLPNAILELKTKSDVVEPLLSLEHNGKTVVSWSLNPESVIRREEHKTASLVKRLAAMAKVYRAGYLIGLHFDPMIYFEGFEKDYEDLVIRIFQVITPERVAWISIGSLRFNPEMKKTIENNFPKTMLTAAEMVLGDDHKMRYVKPLRVLMYRNLYKALVKAGAKDCNIYLCMERWDMWEKIFGFYPDSYEHLDYLMAKNLYERFPGIARSL
ncbi:MAG: hypothetical protein HY843_05350 [Bdellovibrio sp.]|nr:hypothetical protein [Bdellovibrio sp.]